MLKFFGQFHPSIIHFPVALLMLAALAEFVYLFTPRPLLRNVVSFNLYLAVPSSILAAVLGWCLATSEGVTPELQATLYWHRWLGTGTAAIALILLVMWHFNSVKSKSGTSVFRLLLFSSALLVAVTGHLGGQLVYGVGWYEWYQK